MPRPLGATPAPGLDAFLTPDSRPQPPDFRLQTSDPSLLTSDSRLQTPDLRLQTPEESRLQKNPGSRLPQTPLTPDFTVTSDSRLQTPDPRPQETPDSTDSRLQAPDFRLQTPDSRLPPPRRSSSGAAWPSRCGGGATAMTPHSRCLAVALAAALLLRRRRLTAASPAPHRRAAAASPTSRLGAAPAALCRLAVAPLLRRRRLAAAALPLRCRCAAAALPLRRHHLAFELFQRRRRPAFARCYTMALLPRRRAAIAVPRRHLASALLLLANNSPLATRYSLPATHSLLTTHYPLYTRSRSCPRTRPTPALALTSPSFSPRHGPGCATRLRHGGRCDTDTWGSSPTTPPAAIGVCCLCVTLHCLYACRRFNLARLHLACISPGYARFYAAQ